MTRFDEDVLETAMKIFYKVYVDRKTRTGYSGKETETVGDRVRIYVTGWEYEEPEIFRDNASLSAYVREAAREMEEWLV